MRRKSFHPFAASALAALGALFAGEVAAQDVIKIGLVMPLTGVLGPAGKQAVAGARLYVAQHGDAVAGRKIELIVRDDASVPDNSKRITQELIVLEKVAILGGGLTPNVLAIAPLVTESKTATVIMVSGTSIVTERSPYFVRTMIGPGDITDDEDLNAMSDAMIGTVTAGFYSAYHPSAMNKDYVAAFRKVNANVRPNFISVSAYDGMHLIYEALKKTEGRTDGDTLVAAMKGMAWESPRGPISIDPETRDIVQNIYVRRVERVDGELYNVEFQTTEAVKDPGKTKK
jgi:ABC-type branched-subunit amino acid transport system substrate-binding protein